MTMKFEEGDVVALRSERSRVFVVFIDKDHPELETTTLVASGDGSHDEFPTENLVLLCNISDPPRSIASEKPTDDALYDLINKHFLELIDYAREKHGIGKTLTLEIKAKNYSGSRDVDISYEAYVDCAETVHSRSLTKSLHLAVERFLENEAIKPLSLPRY